MSYKLKIYYLGVYKTPLSKNLVMIKTKDEIIKIANNLNIKTIKSIIKNKKPYFTVLINDYDEYKKLKSKIRRA